MPPPATATDLLDRLRKGGLVRPADLTEFLAPLPDVETFTPRELLDRLVAVRLLTPFQAERVAAGKYKGFVLGGYVILDKLGTGGVGHVYLAEHTAMRRLVAIKVLPPGVCDDPVARERFHREARSAAALDHPNIVRVYDLNREGRMLYLVMEYVEGLNLHELVTRSGPLAVPAAAGYGLQVATGLDHAHRHGFVHRDVKPGNLLVDRFGVVKVLDLGLVRSGSEEDSKLTGQLGGRGILGTVDFVAPEQAVDSSGVDVRADLYSLGATLYFLLAGRPLFPEGKTAQKLIWHQTREPTPIRQLRPDVPAGLATAIHTALAKRPEDRYQTPREMAAALSAWAGPAVPDPALIAPPPPRRFGAVSTPPARNLTPPAAIPDPMLTPPPVGSSHVLLIPPASGGARSSVGVSDPTPLPPDAAPIRLAGRDWRWLWIAALVVAAAGAGLVVGVVVSR